MTALTQRTVDAWLDAPGLTCPPGDADWSRFDAWVARRGERALPHLSTGRATRLIERLRDRVMAGPVLPDGVVGVVGGLGAHEEPVVRRRTSELVLHFWTQGVWGIDPTAWTARVSHDRSASVRSAYLESLAEPLTEHPGAILPGLWDWLRRTRSPGLQGQIVRMIWSMVLKRPLEQKSETTALLAGHGDLLVRMALAEGVRGDNDYYSIFRLLGQMPGPEGETARWRVASAAMCLTPDGVPDGDLLFSRLAFAVWRVLDTTGYATRLWDRWVEGLQGVGRGARRCTQEVLSAFASGRAPEGAWRDPGLQGHLMTALERDCEILLQDPKTSTSAISPKEMPCWYSWEAAYGVPDGRALLERYAERAPWSVGILADDVPDAHLPRMLAAWARGFAQKPGLVASPILVSALHELGLRGVAAIPPEALGALMTHPSEAVRSAALCVAPLVAPPVG